MATKTKHERGSDSLQPLVLTEFYCVWMETINEWLVLFPDGTVLKDKFGGVGSAANAALLHLGRGECEFDYEWLGQACIHYFADEIYFIQNDLG